MRANALDKPRLFRPLDEVVCKHTDAASGPWLEFLEPFVQVVEPLKIFDYYSLDFKVVAPYFLNDCSVVNAFHPNPTWLGNFRASIFNPAGTRIGMWIHRLLRSHIAMQRDTLPFHFERSGKHFKKALSSMSIFEANKVAVICTFKPNYRTDEIVTDDLDNDSRFRGNTGVFRSPIARVALKNISTVTIVRCHSGTSVSVTISRMSLRAQVYSPLQNTAVWIAAWLYHATSTDETLTALENLGGVYQFGTGGGVELLAEIRRVADLESREPVVRLVLGGAGDAPALWAHSSAAQALTDAGALIVIGNDGLYHILVPSFEDRGVHWRWFEDALRPPEPDWLSPGEADHLLRTATDQAAAMIEAVAHPNETLSAPRLTVGHISDFYDTPGLPATTTPRAAQIFARADRVSAIIETVKERLGDHTFDQHLLALGKSIRAARTAGVAEAVRDFKTA